MFHSITERFFSISNNGRCFFPSLHSLKSNHPCLSFQSFSPRHAISQLIFTSISTQCPWVTLMSFWGVLGDTNNTEKLHFTWAADWQNAPCICLGHWQCFLRGLFWFGEHFPHRGTICHSLPERWGKAGGKWKGQFTHCSFRSWNLLCWTYNLCSFGEESLVSVLKKILFSFFTIKINYVTIYISAILIFPYFSIIVLVISISSLIHKKTGVCRILESCALSRAWLKSKLKRNSTLVSLCV